MSATKPNDETIAKFKQEVCDAVESSDCAEDYQELCWLSITVGWALAQGMTTAQARDFASYIRYHTDLA